MGEMSFDFPPALRRWIDARLAEGRYADAQDYIRDLIRRDQDGLLREQDEDEQSPEYVAWVREKLAEGEASGIAEGDPRDFIRSLIARRRADG